MNILLFMDKIHGHDGWCCRTDANAIDLDCACLSRLSINPTNDFSLMCELARSFGEGGTTAPIIAACSFRMDEGRTADGQW
jgi:hypothetical protein